MREYLRLILVVLASASAAWFAVRAAQSSLFDFARVTNESMLPYLKPGQMVFISKLSPCLKLPFSKVRFACNPCEAGHAYIFSNPKKPGQKLVKFAVMPPIVALKRDIIWFTHGTSPAAQSLGAGFSCYFEGSNRDNSVDSRHFGAVPVEQIDGRVVYPALIYDRR